MRKSALRKAEVRTSASKYDISCKTTTDRGERGERRATFFFNWLPTAKSAGGGLLEAKA